MILISCWKGFILFCQSVYLQINLYIYLTIRRQKWDWKSWRALPSSFNVKKMKSDLILTDTKSDLAKKLAMKIDLNY